MLGALAYFGLTALVAFAFAAIVGRKWAILPPLLIWPIFALGVTQGWWGEKPDPEALIGFTIAVGMIVAAVGGALGVWVRQTVGPFGGKRVTS